MVCLSFHIVNSLMKIKYESKVKFNIVLLVLKYILTKNILIKLQNTYFMNILSTLNIIRFLYLFACFVFMVIMELKIALHDNI